MRTLGLCLLLLLLDQALSNIVFQGTIHGGDAEEPTAKRALLLTHMSTKTKYPAPHDEELTSTEAPQCRPVQLNYVVRHGTRFPTMKDMRRIARTHERLAANESSPLLMTNTSPSRPSWVATWTNPFPVEREAWLAEAGVMEMISIGMRLRKRFGQDMQLQFHDAKFVFEHTWKPRTQQSAMAFAYGFFKGVQPVFYQSSPIGEDKELRFYDNCPAFEQQIDRNKTATIEFSKYRDSNRMRRNLRRFRELAFNDSLTQDDLEAAYAGCAFDAAARGVFNHWCSLFDEEMILSMDYFHDLKHFYKKSHGNAMAYEIATPLLQDMVQSMKNRVAHKSDIEGHFRFAHAETVVPLASLLNLSEFDRHDKTAENQFLATTPLQVAVKRTFKGSELAPFAANIGFVLYECEGGNDDDSTKPSYRVQALLNEREVVVPGCETPLCPLGQLERVFHKWLYEYNFEEQCEA